MNFGTCDTTNLN